MCKCLISPMEMIRYLKERIAYSNSKLLIYNDERRIVIGKNITEDAMLNFYIEKYELNYSKENIDKLSIFNTYLNLFEKHCITNKKQYKIFIKFLSSLYAKEIYCLIDRLNKIIQKGFSKEMNLNSYMISNNHNLLFISLPKEKYDIEEEDFVSAEIEVVPSGKARDYGLDRSMVAGYGHDDRVCAYTSLTAILDSDVSEYTSCAILVDKEEIGSVGATGAHSLFFENTVAELLLKMGIITISI